MKLQFINAADPVGHRINGPADAGTGVRRGEVFDPVRGRLARRAALASRADVDCAAAAARAAFAGWGAAAPQRRVGVMFRCRDLVERHAGESMETMPACLARHAPCQHR